MYLPNMMLVDIYDYEGVDLAGGYRCFYWGRGIEIDFGLNVIRFRDNGIKRIVLVGWWDELFSTE